MRTLSDEKRNQILEGARAVFREHGFGGASMGRIAREAGVSKGTLYNYFDSKSDLFVAHAEQRLSEYTGRIFELPAERGVRETLQAIGEAYLGLITTSDAEEIYRAVIAEAIRFPEVAERLYERGPERAIERLATFLEHHRERGDVDMGDLAARDAASMFLALVRTEDLMKSLMRLDYQRSSTEVRAHVARAVDFFMRAVGPDESG
jgi:AcrR family transcriptional regulator